jgi:hypothetical protein
VELEIAVLRGAFEVTERKSKKTKKRRTKKPDELRMECQKLLRQGSELHIGKRTCRISS